MTGPELPKRPAAHDQPPGTQPAQSTQAGQTGGSRMRPASARFARLWGNPGTRPRPEEPPYGHGHTDVEQRVLQQLVLLRREVAGIEGSLVVTSDGLLVVQDMPGIEPEQTAALIATTLSVARQVTQFTGRGWLREAVIHGSLGYLAVFAIGDGAVLAVLGGEYLNVGMLHYQTRTVVKRIEKDAGQFRRFATTLP